MDDLDDDGYPTDEALDKIKNWPLQDVVGCLKYAQQLWCYPDRVKVDVRKHPWYDDKTQTIICFSTGGWSGNESVISALESNFGVSSRWEMSMRGGYHEYVMENYE